MVFDGEEFLKIPLKPSWGLLASKGVLQIPINSIAPLGVKTDKPITFAIEVTDAARASRWSDPMQIERINNRWTVHSYKSDLAVPAASLRRATKMQGDLPPVASPRPPIPADEIVERLESNGVSHDLLAKIKDIEVTTTETIQSSEATASSSPSIICLWQAVIMSDEGVGEDYLAYDWWWPSAGMLAIIAGPSGWFGYLDVWGCTPQRNWLTGNYTMYAFSSSTPWWFTGSSVYAYTDGAPSGVVEWLGDFYVESGVDYFIPWWPVNWEHFNATLMGIYGLHFNHGIETTGYKFNVQSSKGSVYSGGEIHLATGDAHAYPGSFPPLPRRISPASRSEWFTL